MHVQASSTYQVVYGYNQQLCCIRTLKLSRIIAKLIASGTESESEKVQGKKLKHFKLYYVLLFSFVCMDNRFNIPNV